MDRMSTTDGPMIGTRKDILAKAKVERDEFWPECPWGFHRLGVRLDDFRGALGFGL